MTACGEGRVLRSSAGRREGRPRGPGRVTMAVGEVAHCTGAGWLASYVERAGSFGRFLSPRDRYMSSWERERERRSPLYFLVVVVFTPDQEVWIISQNCWLVYSLFS